MAPSTQQGDIDNPTWIRTSVLDNCEIGERFPSKTQVQSNLRRNLTDVKDDLAALNLLQRVQYNRLSPREVQQPLIHVHECIPAAVRDKIYLGDGQGSLDLFGSRCSDASFLRKMRGKKLEDGTTKVFEKRTSLNGQVYYGQFFDEVRKCEYLLWNIEVDNGEWVAVIAHLRQSPSTKVFDAIDGWCVVNPRRQGPEPANRVKARFKLIAKEGGLLLPPGAERAPIWVPLGGDSFSSGLRVYTLIKQLIHRITDFYCQERHHNNDFWASTSGWLNIDEVRAEMQGRAAQRCLAGMGYRARIAIEAVKEDIDPPDGIAVPAVELEPREEGKRAFVPGKHTAGGRSVPSKGPSGNPPTGAGGSGNSGPGGGGAGAVAGSGAGVGGSGGSGRGGGGAGANAGAGGGLAQDPFDDELMYHYDDWSDNEEAELALQDLYFQQTQEEAERKIREDGKRKEKDAESKADYDRKKRESDAEVQARAAKMETASRKRKTEMEAASEAAAVAVDAWKSAKSGAASSSQTPAKPNLGNHILSNEELRKMDLKQLQSLDLTKGKGRNIMSGPGFLATAEDDEELWYHLQDYINPNRPPKPFPGSKKPRRQ